MPDTRLTLTPRPALQVLLGISVAGVAAVTLTPEGTGWTWGAPSTELRWYATGLGSSATLLQLIGNLSLLVLPAALAVLVWPSLGRPARLVAAALTAGAAIEALQWALPLGRVVSPVDALLNTAGAMTAGLLVSSFLSSARGLARARPSRPALPTAVAGAEGGLMSNHDHSHPKWEIPPPEASPDPAAGPAAPSTGGMPLVGAAADVPARRSRRESRRPGIRPVRALVAATVGLGLLLGGGVAGIAVAAADGPVGSPAVTVTGAVNDHRGPGMDGLRAGQRN